MVPNQDKIFYLVIAEFSSHRTGLIIYQGSDLFAAETLLDLAMDEMDPYSLTDSLNLPFMLLKRYKMYHFKGERYCPCSVKYQNKRSISNGDLTVSLIISETPFSIEHFKWYRNLPMDEGFSTN
jgi:hypothetical protein